MCEQEIHENRFVSYYFTFESFVFLDGGLHSVGPHAYMLTTSQVHSGRSVVLRHLNLSAVRFEFDTKVVASVLYWPYNHQRG